MHLCMYVCMYACMYDPAALQCFAADAHNGGWQAQPVSFAPGEAAAAVLPEADPSRGQRPRVRGSSERNVLVLVVAAATMSLSAQRREAWLRQQA